MKKMALLIIILIVSCAIFFMLYKQGNIVSMTEKMAELPTEIIEEVGDARENIAQTIHQEREDLVDETMESIQKDYKRQTDEVMSKELQDEIRQEMLESAQV